MRFIFSAALVVEKVRVVLELCRELDHVLSCEREPLRLIITRNHQLIFTRDTQRQSLIAPHLLNRSFFFPGYCFNYKKSVFLIPNKVFADPFPCLKIMFFFSFINTISPMIIGTGSDDDDDTTTTTTTTEDNRDESVVELKRKAQDPPPTTPERCQHAKLEEAVDHLLAGDD
jgi:hypothetical protein